ncbi:response regulator [Planktothrix mougeotii]|uniref:histidine kinase n=1 Tax=Planktothrix mougeotii LEGE 06226 TaxID=1828728 RepID=A0ABR9UAD7_9CYAN|nr:response regulator [Planktothrix mougeotii]MBE9143402.1 response regulator [Planktothrix mougeotii LEGE 06226]
MILYFFFTSLVLVALGWAWQQRQLALGWKASLTELQSMIEHLDCMVIGLSVDYCIQEWNLSAAKHYGYQRHEVWGKNYLKLFVPPSMGTEVITHYEYVLTTKKSVQFQQLVSLANAEEGLIHWNINPSLNPQGKIKGLLLHGYVENANFVWEQRIVEIRDLIFQFPIAIAIFDTQMRYLAYSKIWLSQYNLEDQNLLGKSHYEVFPDIKLDWKIVHQQALKGETISQGEDTWEREDGTQLQQSWVIQPWYKKPSKIGGLILATTPISQLIEEREAALESARHKSHFLAQMSHEIRTPMNGVLGMVELLLETQLTPQQRDYTSTIYCSAQHLLTVINEILDFSKLEAGEARLETVNFDLDSCLETVIDLLTVKAEEKNLELIVQIDSDLPRQLTGDALRLHQILLNLISNAIKFTEKGNIILNIKILADYSDKIKVEFAIKDTGIGIAQELQAQIFQPFSLASSNTNRQYGGTGLGLSICRHLVDLMGGEIGFESALGEGSNFWFNVELSKAETIASKRFPELEQVKLLVVDSNPLVRNSICSFAQTWGIQIDEVEDGNTALTVWKTALEQGNPYDIILIDLPLLNREGVKLVRALHHSDEKSPTKMILMSKLNQRDRAEQVVNLGDYSYLLKPVAPLRFLQTLVLTLNLKSPTILTRLHQWQHQTHRIESFQNRDQRFNLQAHTLKILLAEDDPINQKVILSQLKLLGYDADLVNNGQSVLERLTYKDYDLILMDCQMPIIDGYEATQRLRQHPDLIHRQPIVIALTASAMSSDRERCIEAGMDDYVSKPVELNALGKILQRWSSCKLSDPDQSLSVLQSVNSSDRHPAFAFETSTLESNPMSALTFAESPVNLERLNRLLKGNLQLQHRLLNLFIEQAQIRIQNLHQAILNQDYSGIKQQAHALKGSSASAAVLEMPEIAKQLEDLAQEQTLEGATELVEKLQQCLSRVQVFVQEEISFRSS